MKQWRRYLNEQDNFIGKTPIKLSRIDEYLEEADLPKHNQG